jgi:uncharacterized membrane protein
MFLYFNPHAFIDNLYYMFFGMLGIFVVIGIIIAITYLLNYIFSGKKKDKKAKAENTDSADKKQ